MSYMILLALVVVAIATILFFKYRNRFLESFLDERKPKEGPPIQVGTLNNTPGPIKDLMVELNKTGGQLVADSQYDSVPVEYLDKNKIKNK